MNKRCHLKLTALVCSSVFPLIGICQKFVFLFGSIEPDINFFTYIKGHGDERVSNYILRIIDCLRKKRRWSLLDFYKAGRAAHYIVDSFSFPHTKKFLGSIREHIAWESEIDELLFSQTEIEMSRGYFSDLGSWKKSYHRNTPSPENDITYASSALFALMAIAYSPNFALSPVICS